MAATSTVILPRNMRGAKWVNEAEYLTDDDRTKILAAVERAKASCAEDGSMFGPRSVGVRPPAYTGEPHPIAAIDYGPGGCRLWGCVYR